MATSANGSTIASLNLADHAMDKLTSVSREDLEAAANAIADALGSSAVANSLRAGTAEYLEQLAADGSVDIYGWEAHVTHYHESQPRPAAAIITGILIGYGIGMTVAFILK